MHALARYTTRLDAGRSRRLALVNAAGRCSFGLGALLMPALALRPWLGAARDDPWARMLARALGCRDLAIGVGTLLAGRQGLPLRLWVLSAGLADAGDLAVTLGRFSELPRAGRWAVLLAATGGVVTAGLAAPALERG